MEHLWWSGPITTLPLAFPLALTFSFIPLFMCLGFGVGKDWRCCISLRRRGAGAGAFALGVGAAFVGLSLSCAAARALYLDARCFSPWFLASRFFSPRVSTWYACLYHQRDAWTSFRNGYLLCPHFNANQTPWLSNPSPYRARYPVMLCHWERLLVSYIREPDSSATLGHSQPRFIQYLPSLFSTILHHGH